MVDHFVELFGGETAIHANGVPELFIHVVARLYFGVPLAQFNGQLRIALCVEPVALADAGEQEYFFAYFKHKGIFAKR